MPLQDQVSALQDQVSALQGQVSALQWVVLFLAGTQFAAFCYALLMRYPRESFWTLPRIVGHEATAVQRLMNKTDLRGDESGHLSWAGGSGPVLMAAAILQDVGPGCRWVATDSTPCCVGSCGWKDWYGYETQRSLRGVALEPRWGKGFGELWEAAQIREKEFGFADGAVLVSGNDESRGFPAIYDAVRFRARYPRVRI